LGRRQKPHTPRSTAARLLLRMEGKGNLMAMTTGLRFLVAAKRAEMADLAQLARTSQWVDTTARMIHALQRERGLSNLYLGSSGRSACDARLSQIADSLNHEAALRTCLDGLNIAPTGTLNGARLFSRIAYVLHGLDALPVLRHRVEKRQWNAQRTTEAYSQLVNGLLAVVFEAADTATDPNVSRLLVGLFNFMQGKEWVGQERACGTAVLAAGRATTSEQQRLLGLIESQERCLEVFTDFVSPKMQDLWAQYSADAPMAELERMRRLVCTTPAGQPLDTAASLAWFDACSTRIDCMRQVEERLCEELQLLCGCQLVHAQAELEQLEALSTEMPPPEPTDDDSFFDATAELGAGAPRLALESKLNRAVLELLQAQEGRLQKVSEELNTVRASLNERKVIERAKGLLMAHRQLNEEEAHRMLRQMAMNQGKRLVEVAERVLSMAEVFPTPPR